MGIEVNNKLKGKINSNTLIRGSGIASKGDTGNGIKEIKKTKTEGLIDTYTIYYTNGTTSTFQVSNGEEGKKGDKGEKGEPGEVSKEELNKITENKRVKLEGKSEQETSTQGRNICPNKWELGEYNQSGEKNDTTERVRIPYLVPCKSNTIYYVNMFLSNSTYDIKFILRSYDKSKAFIKNYSAINNATTFTTGTDECYLGITIYDVKSTTSDILNLIKTGVIKPFICLNSETDKTYTEFVPNSPSPDYPSRIRNVGDNINLAQLRQNLWVDSATGKFANINNVYSFVAKVEPNTQYIIHKKYKGNRFVVVTAQTYPENNTDIIRIVHLNNHDLTEYKVTTQSNENYIFVGVYSGTNQDESSQAIAEFKLEQGSIATPYTPYNCGSIDYKKENNTESVNIHISLNKGQVIHKNDYIVDNKIHQKRKTYVITGNENFIKSSATAGHLCIYMTDVIKDCVTNEYSINVKSNIAKGVEYVNRWKSINTVSCRGNTLTFTLDNVTTLEEAKTYFKTQYANGTPVIVEYKLAEEIVTPLTKEQIEAFYELQKAKYVDKMTLTCLNEIEPTLTDIDKSLEESLLDVEKLLAMLSLNN